jgi:hypothetical protein
MEDGGGVDERLTDKWVIEVMGVVIENIQTLPTLV